MTGAFSSPPNTVGVRVSAISRIGTCRSGREPGTWILREPGMGRVTDSESCWACCCRAESCAFIGHRPGRSGTKRRRTAPAPGRHQGAPWAGSGYGCIAKLPYAGMSRIRFQGTISTVATRPRYPRFLVRIRA
ncbi:hypothetical protein D3C73_1070440 [compost metagenome]